MQDEAQSRLDELKKEFETGQVRLHDLEMQQTRLHETLLRISGAIQVLEELLADNKTGDATQPPSSENK